MNEAYPMPHADVPASQIFRAKDVRKSGMLRKKAGGFKFTLLQNPCKCISATVMGSQM